MKSKDSKFDQRLGGRKQFEIETTDTSSEFSPLRSNANVASTKGPLRTDESNARVGADSTTSRLNNESHVEPLIPARMINEQVYCPRLAYLEWVQGEWASSADTVEGTYVHRRVDRTHMSTQSTDDEESSPSISRSIELSSDSLGVIAKIDLLEIENDVAVPVEYKKGKRPHIKHNAWDPDRVQLCVQGLLLRERGLKSEFGVLYYAGSRERVRVPFDTELVDLTVNAINALSESIKSEKLPAPLEDSPKCPKCSLVGICLPDEVNLLKAVRIAARPISVKRTTAYPVYLQSFQGKVTKEGGELVITSGDGDVQEVNKVRLSEVSQLSIFGNAYISTPVMHELFRRRIPVCWYSYGGWFLGHSVSSLGGNVQLRTKQFKSAENGAICLRLAAGFIEAKIKNCRALLMRNSRSREDPAIRNAIKNLKTVAKSAKKAEALDELLGVEGHAAALYFGSFSSMLKEKESAFEQSFGFENRNRRPPLDPVNAMLSYGYALLVKQIAVALQSIGLDPYKGFLHSERFGRPSLALDLMEPFRPLIVDSTVITMINNGEVNDSGFVQAFDSVAMKDSTRKKFLRSFERRLSQEITHPVFDYRIEYRRVFELQARLLGRYLLGDIPDYPNLVVR